MVASAVVAAAAAYSAYSASKASGVQQSAASNAANAQWNAGQQARADQMPWMQSGEQALGQLNTLTGPGGDLNRNFTMADFQADPGYGFRMQQGANAIQGSAAARGGLLSGGAVRDLDQYSQGLASQEYGNAFGRFETQNNDRYNRLASMAHLGQTAASTGGQFGMAGADGYGNYLTQGANAGAAGYMGMGNAISGGLNSWGQWQMMNNMLGQGGGGFNPYGYGSGMEGMIGQGSGMLGGNSTMSPIGTSLPQGMG